MILLVLLVPNPTDDPTISSDYARIYNIYMLQTYTYGLGIPKLYIYLYLLCYKSRNIEVFLHIIVHRLIPVILCKFNKNSNNNYTFLRYIYIRLIDFIIPSV